MLQYQPKKAGGLSRAWLTRHATLAPGDAGGWAAELGDAGEARSTSLRLLYQPERPSAEGGGTITLYGAPRGESCAGKTLCTPTPPVASPLLRGTLD